jgi:signal transduction histidine kinase/BarA-like signal transduction histidine kinase
MQANRTPRPRLDSLSSVLIIDDDEDDVLIIRERLNDFVADNCNFISCCDKQQAIEHLKTNRFDLCLLDHRLGYFDGIEILEALGDEMILTPIIMLTGQDNESVESQAIKKGAQDYIMKSEIDSPIFSKSIRYAVSRKELEFARVSNERFRTENVAKDKFIAHLSHELRTPLTSILGYTSLLLENNMAAPLQKELSIIANNGKHLLNLLNDVLDLSKIAAGKFELQQHETDLHRLIAEVFTLLSVNALDKGLSFECQSLTPIAASANLDELRFKQILINLLGNAIKFTDSGSVTLQLSQNEQNQLILEVSDTGIGMTQEQLKSIFQPFKQVEDVSNRKAGGAGLGLSISAEIIKRMGGKVEANSVAESGTTFIVTLPIDTQPSVAKRHFNADMHEPLQASADNTKLNGKVLIADDVFEIRQLVGQYVKQTGCDVHFARNGKLALDMVFQASDQGDPFDLILMDLHMPVMTGREATLRLGESFPDLPVIAVTAAIQKGTQGSLFDIGFSELLAKPIERDRLIKVLKHYLKAEAQSRHQEKPLDDKRRHICLIEDDIDSANIMQILLSRLDLDVSHFADAHSALTALPEMEKTTFLVDLGLPDMDGKTLIQAIRKGQPDADIVILSGSVVSDDFLNQFQIRQALLKPVSFEYLKTLFTPSL